MSTLRRVLSSRKNLVLLAPAAGALCVVVTVLASGGAPAAAPTATSRLADMRLVGAAQATSSGALRLTGNGDFYVKGAAWARDPVSLVEPFTATVKFRLSPRTPLDGSTGADGLALVIQNDARRLKALGGSGFGMGYGDGEGAFGRGQPGIASSVAVEVDTFQNFVDQFQVEDPDDNHVSVHSRGRATNSTDEQYALRTAPVTQNLSNGQVHTLRVRYQLGTMTVRVDGTRELRLPIQLDEVIASRNAAGLIGVTASSGAASQNHDVLAFRVRQ